jgi:hypothetical protein
VRIAEFSVIADLLAGALLLWGLYRIARRGKAPDFWVLAILGFWCPVFALGLFAWNIPSRYTAMAVIPMLVCAFALSQMISAHVAPHVRAVSRGALDRILAGVAAVLVINPLATAATLNAGYSMHPDHKGAAEFMRTQGITADDVVLAEDVLQQTYYLGRVDYWLIGPTVARKFVMKSGDGVVDFYTGTPVIVTAAMLNGLLEENRGKRVFIIGTGEGWTDGYRGVRGEELHAAIESDRFETIFVGRDGLTRVLRAVPGAAPVPTKPQAPGETRNSNESISPEDQRAIERALIEAPEG